MKIHKSVCAASSGLKVGRDGAIRDHTRVAIDMNTAYSEQENLL
jgi:hypothetical protein